MKSTPEMRARIRELMTNLQDDYDRAVECVLDDLDVMIASHAHISELSDDRVSREEMLEAMREQRINLGGMHDKTLAELKRVREVAAEEINRLQGEVRSLRIDNTRLRDEAAIRSLVSGSTEGGNG